MAKEAPGKCWRKEISFCETFKLFPSDEAAEKLFVNRRWPYGISCPHCGSMNMQTGTKHKTMPYRCREKICAKRFSTKTGTVMEGPKLGFQAWIIAASLMAASLKGVSSIKLHRDLGINQHLAWLLAHRLRAALAEKGGMFDGLEEVEETCYDGIRKNMNNQKCKELSDMGWSAVGKTAVAGIKDRETIKV